MRTIALSLVLISSCCFAAEKSTTELMAYDFNACVDVILSEVESIAYIRSDDPSLMKAREHLGSPPNTNMLVITMVLCLLVNTIQIIESIALSN